MTLAAILYDLDGTLAMLPQLALQASQTFIFAAKLHSHSFEDSLP
jgi:phosphoglycolate phosphatase-like HAD superfamily hydrolase